MKVISKRISYDDLMSKVPGVIPSIVDSWNVPLLYVCGEEEDEVYYSYSSAVKRAHEYNINPSELEYSPRFINFDVNNLREFNSGNYGLIPSDIIIPKELSMIITDYTDIYVNIPISDDKKEDNRYNTYYDLSWPVEEEDPHYLGRKIVSGKTNDEIKVLTYYTLNKWYVFFKEYYNLIERPDYAKTYSSATEYYEIEVEVKNDELKKYYEDLDSTFKARGGKKMYEWICNNCIIQFNIPDKFVDEWNTTHLYFSEAIKWYWWFDEMVEKYKDIFYLEDCTTVEDCCECKDFVRLGGKEFYDKLSAWIKSHKDFDSSATNEASIVMPITFSTSIDDLGEMSILSSDWIEEVDYHDTLKEKGYKVNGTGGTIVNMPYVIDDDGNVHYLMETKIIKNGEEHKGYEYNEYYENVFKEDDWVNYTSDYISNNPDKFASNGVVNGVLEPIKSYTFSPLNGKVIYNPTEIKNCIPFAKKEVVCINGVTYDVIDGKYVAMCYDSASIASIKYKDGTKLQIFKDGSMEYAILNGKRKYVERDSNGIERIYFLKGYNCYDEGCEISEGKYIVVDGTIYLVIDDSVTIKEDSTTFIYPVLDGYLDINSNRFYIDEDKVVIPNSSTYTEEADTYVFEFRELNREELIAFGFNSMIAKSNCVEINYMFENIDCTIVSGFCDSKLDLLRRKEISTDDLGNELPGYFRSVVDIDKPGEQQSHYNNTYNECTLDILYRVGEVSSLKVNKELTGDAGSFFDGNIITNIEFYYKNKFGEKLFVTEANNDDALIAIGNCKQACEDSENDEVVGGMYCDITYYFGAVIKIIDSKYVLDEEHHSGVKYIDTLSVKKSVGNYYLGNGRRFTFKFYLLSQNVSSVDLSDFRTFATSDYSTYFEIVPLLYYYNDEKQKIENANTEEYLSGWSKNNDTIVAPVFRTEFNLASSLPQNVDANIYIDRGINAAFEKHLKLQEVRTMEALETYSNGTFKINKY